MLDDFKEIQPIAYRILTNSIKKNKISHAYLIETNGYPKKMDFALSVVKFLLCPKNNTSQENCEDCSLCHRIDTNNFTEIKIIEPDGLWIKKEQLEQLQQEFSTKSIETTKKIYIINSAEKLNLAAANSMLKFLEEPEPGIIAILLTDNIYQLIDTIISRCQIIPLRKVSLQEWKNQFQGENQTIFNIAIREATTMDELSEMLKDEQCKFEIDTAIHFIDEYEKKHKEILLNTNLLWNSIFKEKKQTMFGINVMILFYKDVLNLKLDRKIEIFQENQKKLDEISKKNTIQQVCKKIKILIDTKEKIKYNANSHLLIDRMIIDLEGV